MGSTKQLELWNADEKIYTSGIKYKHRHEISLQV